MMKKICYTLLPIVCLLLACTSETKKPLSEESKEESTSMSSDQKPSSTSSKIEALSSEYPEAYKSMNLPLWDKATVEQANKIKNDRGTKYQIALATKENVHTAAKYYSKAMSDAGWTVQNSGAKAQQMDKRSLRFVKKNQQTMINVIDLPDSDKRVITVVFSVKE
ncbi:MAG: hypothetical protein AB8F74_01500 [Saprospiraceae bacterium]